MMAEPDRPLTAATSNTQAETEPSATDILELHEIPLRHEDHNGVDYSYNNEYAPGMSSASLSSDETRIVPIRTVSSDRERNGNRDNFMIMGSHKKRDIRAWARVRHFWCGQVALVVPQKSSRDHYALERTFLAYIRTSVVLSMQGVLIAQLFRLQRFPPQEQTGLTYFEVAVPLSVACHGIALMVAVIGASRFWRQQSAIVEGTVHAGGWELNSIGFMILLVVIAMLVLAVIITVRLDGSR